MRSPQTLWLTTLLLPDSTFGGRHRTARAHSPGTARAQRQSCRCSSHEHPLQTASPHRSVHDPFKTASGVQNPGPWDPWLPGVENSRLFAQRAVRPLGA